MLSSTACSSDEETEKSEVLDYKTTFLAHEWQISALYQRVGSIFIDVKEAPFVLQNEDWELLLVEK